MLKELERYMQWNQWKISVKDLMNLGVGWSIERRIVEQRLVERIGVNAEYFCWDGYPARSLFDNRWCGPYSEYDERVLPQKSLTSHGTPDEAAQRSRTFSVFFKFLSITYNSLIVPKEIEESRRNPLWRMRISMSWKRF